MPRLWLKIPGLAWHTQRWALWTCLVTHPHFAVASANPPAVPLLWNVLQSGAQGAPRWAAQRRRALGRHSFMGDPETEPHGQQMPCPVVVKEWLCHLGEARWELAVSNQSSLWTTWFLVTCPLWRKSTQWSCMWVTHAACSEGLRAALMHWFTGTGLNPSVWPKPVNVSPYHGYLLA